MSDNNLAEKITVGLGQISSRWSVSVVTVPIPKFDPLRGYSRLMTRLKTLLTGNNDLSASGKGRG